MESGNMTLSDAIEVLKNEKAFAESHAGKGVTGLECRKFVDAVDVVCEFVDRAAATFAKIGSWEDLYGIPEKN